MRQCDLLTDSSILTKIRKVKDGYKYIIEQIKPIDRQKVAEAQNRFTILSNRSVHIANWKLWFLRYAGIIGSADKKSVQYPKKALFLWSADTDSVAKAMQEELPVVLLAREAKAEVYPLLVTSCNLEEALEEGAILTKEYIFSDKLQMLALGSLEKYTLTEQTEAFLRLEGIEFLQKLNDPVITAMTGAVLTGCCLQGTCNAGWYRYMPGCCRSLQISSGSS